MYIITNCASLHPQNLLHLYSREQIAVYPNICIVLSEFLFPSFYITER